jgi:hypothetical protein
VVEDDVGGVDVAGVDVVGVNDGVRFRGVKIDSRSGPASSVFDSFFGDGLSSFTDEADEAEAFFGFPILSAGSGGTAPFSASSLALTPELPFALAPALPLAAGDAAGATGTIGATGAAVDAPFPLSSAHDDDPPALVRDDDMMPLSVTASSVSTSGSVSRTGGAIMNGVRVVGPASSTPSSSVLTVPLRTFA